MTWHGPYHRGAMREHRARKLSVLHAIIPQPITRRSSGCTCCPAKGHSDMALRSQDRSCSVNDCTRDDYYARGLCRFHYHRLNKRGTTDDPPPRVRRSCTIDGCDKPRARNGLCQKHHCRLKRNGTRDLPLRPAPIERFMAKVERGEACWTWTGARNERGYGRFFAGKVNGRRKLLYAHRWSYEHFVGPIPDGLVIDHLCRNRACVNPAHLEAVTMRENLLRGEHPSMRTARTGICKRGHSMANADVQRNGHRRCRECRRAREAVA